MTIFEHEIHIRIVRIGDEVSIVLVIAIHTICEVALTAIGIADSCSPIIWTQANIIRDRKCVVVINQKVAGFDNVSQGTFISCQLVSLHSRL